MFIKCLPSSTLHVFNSSLLERSYIAHHQLDQPSKQITNKEFYAFMDVLKYHDWAEYGNKKDLIIYGQERIINFIAIFYNPDFGIQESRFCPIYRDRKMLVLI